MSTEIPSLVDLCVRLFVKDYSKYIRDPYENLIIFQIPEEVKNRLAVGIGARLKAINDEFTKLVTDEIDEILEKKREAEEKGEYEKTEYEVLSDWSGRLQLTTKPMLNLRDRLLIRGLNSITTSVPNHFKVVYFKKLNDSEEEDPFEEIDRVYAPNIQVSSDALALVLSKCKLRSVILEDCDFINDKVLQSISGDGLIHINLSKCWNFEENTLISLLKRSPDLRFLSLAGCTQISEKTVGVIKQLSNLVELDLSDCLKLTPSAYEKLQIITTLRKLYLTDCKALTNKSIAFLGLFSHLEYLDISGCVGVTDKGISLLAESAKFDNLKELCLNGCPQLSPIAVLSLLQNLPQIQVLQLRNYTIKDMKKVKTGSVTTLLSLDLKNSLFDTAFDLRQFLYKFEALRSLSLEGLKAITNSDNIHNVMDMISTRMTNLEHLDDISFNRPTFFTPASHSRSHIPPSDQKPRVPFASLRSVTTTDIRYYPQTTPLTTWYFTHDEDGNWHRPLQIGGWTAELKRICFNFDTWSLQDNDLNLINLVSNCTKLEILQIHNASFTNAEADKNAEELMKLPENCATLKVVQISSPIGFNVPPSKLVHDRTKFILQLLTLEDLHRIHEDINSAEYDYRQFIQQ